MALDFGFVQNYNSERGFGFVNRTFQSSHRPAPGIFFHISNIKRDYPDLASDLDNGLYYGVSFWYKIENSDRGEQVSRLWLDVKEIPNQQRDPLIAYVDELWRSTNIPNPSWLNQVTLALVGQDRRDELKQERERCIIEQIEAGKQEQRRREAERQAQLRIFQEEARSAREERRRREAERQAQERTARKSAQKLEKEQRKVRQQTRVSDIQCISQKYGIETLTHFTRSQNLPGILKNGLLSRSALESQTHSQLPQYSDSYRLDGYREAICLSVSFPNYQMFYRYSQNNRQLFGVKSGFIK